MPDTLVTLSTDGDDERKVALVTDVSLLDVRWSPDGLAIGALTNLRANFASQQSIVAFDAATGKRRLLYRPAAGTLVRRLGLDRQRRPRRLRGHDAVRARRQPAAARSPGGGPPGTLLSLQKPPGRLDVAGPGRVVIDQRSPIQNLAEWPLVGRSDDRRKRHALALADAGGQRRSAAGLLTRRDAARRSTPTGEATSTSGSSSSRPAPCAG